MTKRPILILLISNIVLGLLVYFYMQNKYNNVLSYFTGKNILTDSKIAWGSGWDNLLSRYGGSEFRFIMADSSKISFKVTSPNKEQAQGQGIEIFVDGKVYIHELPNLDERELTIFLENKTVPHTVRVRHFCSGSYSPCEVTIKSIITDTSSTLFIPPKIPQKKMAILGDSISVGWGRSNFTFIVADRLEYQLHNAGVFGSSVSKINKDKVDWVIDRYRKDIIEYKPDLVIIFLGTNDAGNNIPLDNFKSDYQELLTNIKKELPETKIITLGILFRRYPPKNKIVPYTKIIKSISDSLGVSFIDPYDWLKEDGLMDDVHPNHIAQTTLANRLSAELLAVLEK